MSAPATKGTAMLPAIERVNALLEQGRLAPDDLPTHLLPEDIELLGRTIYASAWYPVVTLGRLLRLLMEVEGEGEREYLIREGRLFAEELRSGGIYHQLEASERVRLKTKGEFQNLARSRAETAQLRESFEAAFGHITRLLRSLAQSIFNFGDWQFSLLPVDGGCVGYTLEIRDAKALPDELCLILEGFVEAGTSHAAGVGGTVSTTRPDRDRVVLNVVFDTPFVFSRR